jgi:peptidoglycan/LPS O-acetylase OafA/YrhL
MYWFGITALAGSLIFAVFLRKFVVDPIEKIRQRRVVEVQPKTVTT